MKAVALLVFSMLLLTGCSLDLPQVSALHPANSGAPSGQVYATPAELEIRPLSRPSDYPTSGPGYTMPPGVSPMKEMQMRHGGMQHNHQTGEMHGEESHMMQDHINQHQGHSRTQPDDSKTLKQMRQEGQLHE